jgi:hypothetical protein
LEPDVSDTATEQVTEQVDQAAAEAPAPEAPILPESEWTDEYLRSFITTPTRRVLSGDIRNAFVRARTKAIYGDPVEHRAARAAQKAEAAAAEKVAEEAAEPISFVSTSKESFGFEIMGIRPEREPGTWNLLWRVPAAQADVFAQHHHVQMGRVRRS